MTKFWTLKNIFKGNFKPKHKNVKFSIRASFLHYHMELRLGQLAKKMKINLGLPKIQWKDPC